MFNIHDIVNVLDETRTYDRDSWYFIRNDIEYLESNFQRDKLPNTTSKYIVRFICKNNDSCIIQDLRTQQVYIVENNEKTLTK